MRYLTRYFKSLEYLNSNFLEDFQVDDRAETYNKEFYEYLCMKKIEESNKSLSKENEDIHSITHTGTALYLLSNLPTSITQLIADVRVFLLYTVSPCVYEKIETLCKENKALSDIVYKDLLNKYNSDKLKVPKHWLALYDIGWEQAGITEWKEEAGELDIVVKCVDLSAHHIKFINPIVKVNDGKLDIPTLVFYVEVFYENQKIQLNFLTPFTDFTIEATDVLIIK
ncbi:hypothetical protein acsn021_11120 [Anaerocolumna cellulosilytica]|uniref:Uncharacterized protein n=1 Tax=Anaerocolumna cellulosilytica TaxID=433286 RepID=A0A6S6QQC8_9FIRM|nr:hypothetical protein [Anaerocolumna cellulosilytica]MBB5194599.1 hypothetical protein [Anaerocolumna cellulosilytica]BCJ93543.1 hypothetical protein acsn021_11120 [Anaerocolumna cellulosilytica]